MGLRSILAPLALSLACGFGLAEDWAGWRGPRSDGTVADSGYPLTWSETKNVKWKTPLPGGGHASPVVSKGKVFVAGCVEGEKQRVLYCVNRTTGKIEWERVALVSNLERKHGENSYASSTPAADGERVYVTFLDQPQMRIYCYDYSGNLLWEKNPGEFYSQHGFCSPPTLYKDFVIVNASTDSSSVM